MKKRILSVLSCLALLIGAWSVCGTAFAAADAASITPNAFMLGETGTISVRVPGLLASTAYRIRVYRASTGGTGWGGVDPGSWLEITSSKSTDASGVLTFTDSSWSTFATQNSWYGYCIMDMSWDTKYRASFYVGNPTMTAQKTEIAPGGDLTLTLTDCTNFTGARIGVFAAGDTAYDHALRTTTGTLGTAATLSTDGLTFGDYVAVLFLDNTNARVAARVPFTVDKPIYLSDSGNDDNSGLSADAPVRNMWTALKKATAEGGGRSVKVIGTYSAGWLNMFNSGTAANNVLYTGDVTIAGASPDAALKITGSGNQWIFGGAVTFKNIRLTAESVSYFSNNVSPIVIGEGVTTDGNFRIAGGGNKYNTNFDGKDISITVNSGTFGDIAVGTTEQLGNNEGNVVRGKADVHIGSDAVVDMLSITQLKTPTYTPSPSYTNAIFGGNVNIVVDGTVKAFRTTTQAARLAITTPVIKGAFTLVCNNGSAASVTAFPAFVHDTTSYTRAEKGVWILKGEKKDGCRLEATDTAGTLSVTCPVGFRAMAVSDTQTVYSKNGTLTVPEGVYTVTYVEEEPDCIYCNPTGGNDANNGATPAAAMKTFAKAVNAASRLGEGKRIVRLIGAYSATAWTNWASAGQNNTNMVTVTGADSGASISNTNVFVLGGPLTFKDIKMDVYAFLTNGNELVIDSASANISCQIYTKENCDLSNIKYAVNAGTVNAISPGSYYNKVTTNTTTNVDIYIGKNATLNGLSLTNGAFVGANGGTDQRCAVHYAGVFNFVADGTVKNVHSGVAGMAPVFDGALQIILNNANSKDTKFFWNTDTDKAHMSMDAKNGMYVLLGDGKGSLTTTATVGTYEVTSSYTYAVAKNNQHTYISRVENGKTLLTVSPCGYEGYTSKDGSFYQVSYGNNLATLLGANYYNDGERIVAAASCTVDLSKEAHADKPGAAFAGWKRGGEYVNRTVTLAKGDVLTAEYVVMGDMLAMRAPEIRLEDNGLRFTTMKGTVPAGLGTVTEYGTLVAAANLLNDADYADLTVATGKTVRAVNTYGQGNGQWYTAVVCGLSATTDPTCNYQTLIAARPYVKYTDQNGVEQIAYAEAQCTNGITAAQTELNGGSPRAGAKTALNKVISDMKAALNALISKASSYSITRSFSTASDFTFVKTADGQPIRQVTVNAGLTEPYVITQISDLHFNRLNDADKAGSTDRNNATVWSSAKDRVWHARWNMAESSYAGYIGNIRNALEMAGVGDFVITTGDTLDYLTLGGIEMTERELWARYPSAWMINGNHDYVQSMVQGNNASTKLYPNAEVYSVSPTAADGTYAMLNAMTDGHWADGYTASDKTVKNDITYASMYAEGTGQKLMIIQLDNGTGSFLASQKAKLSADLAAARKSGATVLLFMHEVMGSVANVELLHTDDSSSTVADLKSTVTENKNDATAAIYSLVRENADIIKGIFNGHAHADFFSTISGTGTHGSGHVIPQHTMTGSCYAGAVVKITVQ